MNPEKNKFDNTYNAIINRRSIRRFKQEPIENQILKKLVNTARLAPSAANLQLLEFIAINKKELCEKIFINIGWAGYLKNWSPSPNEQPTAYIIILSKDTSKDWNIRDASLASENIVITAESIGLGSCILLNIKKEEIKKILNIPEEIEIDSIIALGYKDEKPVIEDFNDTIKYWHDDKQVLHVPKKRLEDILHLNKY